LTGNSNGIKKKEEEEEEHWHRPVPTRQSEKVHKINYCR
jgi:hypothetical protein